MIDLTGRKYNLLTVIEKVGKNNRGEQLWRCSCVCGGVAIRKSANLLNAHAKSCGCLRRGVAREKLEGRKFNKLTILSYVGRDKFRSSLYECICECGNKTKVKAENLKTGKTKSCGCLIFKPKNPELTLEEKEKARWIPGYADWALAVKEKCNCKCFVCDKRSPARSIAHHIYNYKDNPSLRLDINNGACLCKSCHQVFHILFSRRFNNLQQLKELRKFYEHARSSRRLNRQNPPTPIGG